MTKDEKIMERGGEREIMTINPHTVDAKGRF